MGLAIWPHGAHSGRAGSIGRSPAMATTGGAHSSSPTPITRTNYEHPVSGDDLTREQAGCQQSAHVPWAVMPSKATQYQHGVGLAR